MSKELTSYLVRLNHDNLDDSRGEERGSRGGGEGRERETFKLDFLKVA